VADRLERVGRRSGWICWICGEPTSRELPCDDPRRASVDHVIPLALGGTSTAKNLRLAHAECNTRRGATLAGLSREDRLSLRETGELPYVEVPRAA